MITLTRPVIRETAHHEQGRAIVVMLEVGGRLIRFRQKGRRQWHVATVAQCYWQAVENTAQEEKAARIQKRKEKLAIRKGVQSA